MHLAISINAVIESGVGSAVCIAVGFGSVLEELALEKLGKLDFPEAVIIFSILIAESWAIEILRILFPYLETQFFVK